MTALRLLKGALATGLVALLVLSAMPAPAAANPVVPYCGGSVAPIPNTVPPQIQPQVCEALTGRVFPEAIESPAYAEQGFTTAAKDYVAFSEFQAGLTYLAGTPAGQQYMTIHEVATSVGLCPVPNCADDGRDRFPIYIVELTNKESPFPIEERQSLLFMLSIHGNEKGGREGGFRVLEDLVKGFGFASEGVQNGAGLPTAIARPTGEGNVETYHDYLDFMRVFLLFPNVDGWAHDEAPYVATDPYCGTLFCRTNGHNVDLNRQAPTLGWQNPARNVVGEPESTGYYNWLLTNNITWGYAIDIHGMLNHQNFVAIMLPAGSMTPQEMQRSVRLAETLKERLNGNEHFAAWNTLFGAGESATGPANSLPCTPNPTPVGPNEACAQPGSAIATAGSTQFAEYYTVIDAIGYTDSGFNGDYFAQDTGLNAPGYDIELAYNHITVDSQYEAGAVFNDYHVKSVREIVKSFLDAAGLDVRIKFETAGSRTLYVEPSFVATNLDDRNATAGGWADENAGDDIWDYGADQPFFARPAKYWDDMRPFVASGDEPGVLVKTAASGVTLARLRDFDTFVIPGSAIRDLEDDQGALNDIRTWVEEGGNLVLTDEALRFVELSGIAPDSVDSVNRYMGGIRMDLTHPMLAKVRGGVKQTYEPTPLGFEVGANAAPNWFIDAGAFGEIKGAEIAGIECGTPNLSDPCTGNGVSLGRFPLGTGQVQFIGALLPDPTEEFYHPYGLDHYATTYSGNQVLRNMLGWDEVFDAPPVVLSDSGEIIQSDNEPEGTGSSGNTPVEESKEDTPAPGVLLAGLALLAAAFVALRRRTA